MRTLEQLVDEAVHIANAARPFGDRAPAFTKFEVGQLFTQLARLDGLDGWPTEEVPTEIDDKLMMLWCEGIAAAIDVIAALTAILP